MMENQIQNDVTSENAIVTIKNSKFPEESPTRTNRFGANMSEGENMFSLATSSMNSKNFKGHQR